MVKNTFKKKFKLPEEARIVIFEALIFLLGFVLTPLEFIMGLYPFGLCFALATKSYALFSICGSALSVIFFMDADPVYLIALISILVLRAIASFLSKNEKRAYLLGESRVSGFFSGMFKESVTLRVSISIAVALGLGIYYVIVNGYKYYDIFALVFSLALFPVLTYAFCGLYEGKKRSKHLTVSLIAIAFCIAYMLHGREIFGIDLSIVLSYMLVLYISKNVSSPIASAVGLLLGIASNITFAPAFALAGIISGFSWHISSYLAIMSSFIISMGYGIFASGYEAIAYLAPEILGGSLIMYPLLRFEILPKPEFLMNISEKKKTADTHIIRREGQRISNGIRKISGSFGDISKMLYDVSEKAKIPDRTSYERMCIEACEGYCFSCPKEEICWKKDIDTTKSNIGKMSEDAYHSGEAGLDSLDEKFIHRCPNVEKIIDKINAYSRESIKTRIKSDKLLTCASNLDLSSKMIQAYCDKETGGEKESDRLCSLAIKCATVCGLQFEKIEILGINKRQIIIAGVDTVRSTCTLEELKEALSLELGIKLDTPVLHENGSLATIEIDTLPMYNTTSNMLSISKDGEINGDSVASFKSDDGREYFLICDGMGSGKNAFLTSSMCTSFLEKILTVSPEKELALSMLNNFIRAKDIECSSSVDLLEIDLSNGASCFLKSGAAPSFIKRGEKVFKLQSKTAPLGIMKRLDSEKLSFTFEVGDICVMISDGIANERQDSSWLIGLLRESEGESPNELCQKIMSYAKGNEVKDDMSVCVVKFE